MASFKKVFVAVFLSLASLLPSNAHAFVWYTSGSDSDPSSDLEGYFSDQTRSDRDAFQQSGEPFQEGRNFLAAWKGFSDFLAGADPRVNAVKGWLDWDAYLQLNLEAARTWEEMVDCAGGDVERARIGYYAGEGICVSPGAREDSVVARLKSLHASVRAFTASTEVTSPSKYTDRDGLEKVRQVLPAHPLYGQILIEQVSTIVKFHQKESMVMSIKDPHWIDAEYPGTLGERVTHLIWLDYLRSRAGFSEDLAEYVTARMYLNGILLMNLLHADDNNCGPWGLWPAVSAILTTYIRNQRLHNAPQELYLVSTSLGCVPRRNLFSSNLMDPGIVTEFRGMAERYGLKTNRDYRCYFNSGSLLYAMFFLGEVGYCKAADPASPTALEDQMENTERKMRYSRYMQSLTRRTY